jgi:hypothetical protein
MIKYIKNIIKSHINHFNNDAINCKLYKQKGCEYIDGPYCNYPCCELLKHYKKRMS